jgi:tripartite-type tricarboxylate transporter receptor subunit TctC
MANVSVRRRGLLLACAASALLPARAQAQAWPDKPVKLVFPYPAGGGGDPLARMVGAAIAKGLGQQVLVEFMPGANGSIGTGHVARSAHEANTLLFTSGTTIVQNKLLRANLGYDTEQDLSPIARFADQPMLIVVNPAKVPATNLQQLVAYAKAHPGKLNVSTPGIGSLGQLAALLMEQQAGVKLNLVPYNTGRRLIDLLSGDIDMTIDPPTPYLPHLATGKLVPIAVMSPARSETLPSVPTTAEGGYPQMISTAWFGVWGARDMPRAAVARVNAAMNEFLRSDDGRSQLARFALVPTPTTPEVLREQVRQEMAKWGPIIRDANIRVE